MGSVPKKQSKKSSESMSRAEKIALVLRFIILATGLYQIIFGEFVIGLMIMVALGAILLPSLFSRGRIKTMPLEFELIFFTMIMLQFVIGETLNFYDNVPYYDKLVHFSLPFFLGLISFLFAYTMQAAGKLEMSNSVLIIVLVFFSLGIGALWEIMEYASDVLLLPHFPQIGNLQGSLTASPLVDTMNDLIADTLGAFFGAFLGLRYMGKHRNDASSKRLVDEIANNLFSSK